MTTKLTQDEVFTLIAGERKYQDSRWNPSTTTSNGDHSWEEWIMYIEYQIGLAKAVLSSKPRQESDPIAAGIMRKIGALAVSAMQNKGASPRQVIEVKLS